MKKCTAVLLLLLLAYALPACAASVVLPESTVSIGERAFMNDTSISRISMPASVKEIGKEAFAGCTGLRMLVVPGKETPLNENMFGSLDLTQITVAAPISSRAWTFAIDHGMKIPAARALLIGQTHYESGILEGCDNDIEGMKGMLIQRHWAEEQITSKTDLDGQVEFKNAIQEAFAGAQENDVSLFYYSGHGLEASANPGLNGSLCGIHGNNVNPAELYGMLQKIEGTKLVIVDACRSGQLIGRGGEASSESFADAFISAFSLNARSAGAELAESGFYVLTAVSKNQDSYSVAESVDSGSEGFWKGLFTSYFIRGCGWDMESQTPTELHADADQDQQITWNELYAYTREKVNAYIQENNRGWRKTDDNYMDPAEVQVWPENCEEVFFVQ